MQTCQVLGNPKLPDLAGFRFAVKLTPAHRTLLQRMAAGCTLKAHRDLEGRKDYRLHPLEGEAEPVRAATVEALAAAGLIDSNKKFPAATFWLTPAARAWLAEAP